MTTATHPTVPSLATSSRWSVLGLFSAALRAARRRAQTPAEAQLDRLLTFSTGAFGTPLLGAHDLDDLDDRIEAILHGDDYWSFLRLLASLAPNIQRRGFARRNRGLSDVMDDLGGASKTIEQGDELEACIANVVETLYSHLPQLPAETFEVLRRERPVESLYDPQVAPEVRRAVWGAHVATVCSMGLLASQEAAPGSTTEPWLMLALATRRRDGLRGFLQLLASVPDVSVPEDLVAASQRWELGALEARHQRGLARASELFAGPSEGLGPEWD